MAQELDDGEFWLPSDFLTDEDLLTDFKPLKKNNELYQGFGNSFWCNSDMSSPVESVNGSTETESDEDEVITGLTRSMAQSTLQDSSFYSDYGAKGWKLSGSPQSTLCGCKQGSSRGSPDSVSRVSSPPPAKDDGWDFLCAAAGEVTRMRLMEETTPFYAPPQRPAPVSMPVNRTNSTMSGGFYSNQVQAQARLAYLQLQASQLQRMKDQQMMNSGVWSQPHSGKTVPAARCQALSMAAWPTLQQSQQQQPQPQQSGSGMRAVFLGGSAAKKERTGTGVFLPRRFGTNTSAPRKKPGCSTVLLPDRVVHALNLNLDSLDTQSHLRTHGNFSPEFDYDSATATAAAAAALKNIPPRVMHQEFRLPKEWTY